MEPYLWQIHFLSAASPTLIRIVVGFYFLYIARFIFREQEAFMQIRGIPLIDQMKSWMIPFASIMTALVAILFITGFQTPLASLIGIIISLKHWYGTKDYAGYLPFSKSTYILLLIMCLSLLVTGPGILGFDSPLY